MDEERLTATLAWARSVLGPVQWHELKRRPWAATWRAERSGADDVFVKCSTAHTGHEAALLSVLTQECPDLVPHLVAADLTGHRLIVASAGRVLREISNSEKPNSDTFDLDTWIPLVRSFAQLQRAIMPRVNELVSLGIPDERPEQHLAMLRSFTLAPQLPQTERDRLKDVAERWESNGSPLATSLIAPSVQHGDLHDNNVAVDESGASRFFDFGDSSVAHPFTTMDLPLLFAEEDLDPAGVNRLADTYLEVFSDLAPLPQLRTELQSALAVAPLQRACNWRRALQNDNSDDSPDTWDPQAATEWNNPVEYWLSRLT